jgi:UDP:flavonoid glycosyltransferase YjiC (YdhE family)
LEYAVERFTPDVVLASHLTLGPVAFCTRRRLPLVIVGPIAYLWPLAGPSTDIDAPRARTAAWRYAEFRSFYRAACNELRLAFDESLLLGDRYLLQSVPILDPQIAPLLPPGVREVGACTLESPTAATDEVETWIEEHRTAGRPVAFVQLGRTFGVGDPWPAIAGWAAAEGVALFASLERYDAPVAAANGHVIIRNGIAFDRIVPQVDVVICSGTPSPLLAAALAGKPALIATSGSGSEEHAALFTRYGAALSFSAATVDPQHIAQLAQRIRIEPLFAQRAQALRNAYREFGGPQLAADEVEIAAGVAA